MNEETKVTPQGEPVLQVSVVNKNEFTITDHYNGVKFIFNGSLHREAPSKPVRCIPEVAGHIFGYRPWPGLTEEQMIEAMKNYCAKRHGWNTSKMQDEGKDQRYFDNIEISPVRMRLVEEAEGETTLPEVELKRRK